jgi:hypothetical protein
MNGEVTATSGTISLNSLILDRYKVNRTQGQIISALPDTAILAGFPGAMWTIDAMPLVTA